MTQWTFQFKLIDNNGNVTSRIMARHDDENLSDVQARFTEFLRGCGYHLPDHNREREMLDEAMRLLYECDGIYDPGERWVGEYLELYKDYEGIE